MRVVCPACATNLNVPETAAGRRVRCPKCSGTVAVPAQQAAVASSPSRRPSPVPLAADLGPGGFALDLDESRPSTSPLAGPARDDIDDLLEAAKTPPPVDEEEDEETVPVLSRRPPVVPDFTPSVPPHRVPAADAWPPAWLRRRLRVGAICWEILAAFGLLGALLCVVMMLVTIAAPTTSRDVALAQTAAVGFYLSLALGQCIAALPVWTVSVVLRWLAEPRPR